MDAMQVVSKVLFIKVFTVYVLVGCYKAHANPLGESISIVDADDGPDEGPGLIAFDDAEPSGDLIDVTDLMKGKLWKTDFQPRKASAFLSVAHEPESNLSAKKPKSARAKVNSGDPLGIMAMNLSLPPQPQKELFGGNPLWTDSGAYRSRKGFIPANASNSTPASLSAADGTDFVAPRIAPENQSFIDANTVDEDAVDKDEDQNFIDAKTVDEDAVDKDEDWKTSEQRILRLARKTASILYDTTNFTKLGKPFSALAGTNQISKGSTARSSIGNHNHHVQAQVNRQKPDHVKRDVLTNNHMPDNKHLASKGRVTIHGEGTSVPSKVVSAGRITSTTGQSASAQKRVSPLSQVGAPRMHHKQHAVKTNSSWVHTDVANSSEVHPKVALEKGNSAPPQPVTAMAKHDYHRHRGHHGHHGHHGHGVKNKHTHEREHTVKVVKPRPDHGHHGHGVKSKRTPHEREHKVKPHESRHKMSTQERPHESAHVKIVVHRSKTGSESQVAKDVNGVFENEEKEAKRGPGRFHLAEALAPSVPSDPVKLPAPESVKLPSPESAPSAESRGPVNNHQALHLSPMELKALNVEETEGAVIIPESTLKTMPLTTANGLPAEGPSQWQAEARSQHVDHSPQARSQHVDHPLQAQKKREAHTRSRWHNRLWTEIPKDGQQTQPQPTQGAHQRRSFGGFPPQRDAAKPRVAEESQFPPSDPLHFSALHQPSVMMSAERMQQNEPLVAQSKPLSPLPPSEEDLSAGLLASQSHHAALHQSHRQLWESKRPLQNQTVKASREATTIVPVRGKKKGLFAEYFRRLRGKQLSKPSKNPIQQVTSNASHSGHPAIAMLSSADVPDAHSEIVSAVKTTSDAPHHSLNRLEEQAFAAEGDVAAAPKSYATFALDQAMAEADAKEKISRGTTSTSVAPTSNKARHADAKEKISRGTSSTSVAPTSNRAHHSIVMAELPTSAFGQ